MGPRARHRTARADAQGRPLGAIESASADSITVDGRRHGLSSIERIEGGRVYLTRQVGASADRGAAGRARGERGIGSTLARLGRVALAERDAATARQLLTQALTVERDGGYVWGIPPRLGDLAQVAQAQGQPERAARLRGAAAQHLAIVGHPLLADPDLLSDTPEQAADALRARLGDAAFDAAWAEGQALIL